MLKLPLRTWVRNAASVFSGQRGDVTRQAEESQCSRQTVYQHAQKLEQRVSEVSQPDTVIAQLRLENQQLQRTIAELRDQDKDRVLLEEAMLQRFAIVAFAAGSSLRQIEELLAVLVSPSKVPDHSTLGRWVQATAERAEKVLTVIDSACTARVGTLAVDEIFFGGDRPWLVSSQQA